jgi:hypothetical protein
MLNHELWLEPDGLELFVVSGPHGDEARALLTPGSKLVWEVTADSYFEAMTKYFAYMDWGVWTTDFPEHDKTSYRDRGWDTSQNDE